MTSNIVFDSMGSIAITSSMTAGGIGKIGDKVPTAAEEVYDVTDGTDYNHLRTYHQQTN